MYTGFCCVYTDCTGCHLTMLIGSLALSVRRINHFPSFCQPQNTSHFPTDQEANDCFNILLKTFSTPKRQELKMVCQALIYVAKLNNYPQKPWTGQINKQTNNLAWNTRVVLLGFLSIRMPFYDWDWQAQFYPENTLISTVKHVAASVREGTQNYSYKFGRWKTTLA